MKRSFALAFMSVSIVSHLAFAADEWQPIKVNGHDYLTVENVAKFYGLPAEVTAPGGKIQIETVTSTEFVRGSRRSINGARSWLCFPLTEQNGKFLVSRTDVAKTISRWFVRSVSKTSAGSDCRSGSGHGGR